MHKLFFKSLKEGRHQNLIISDFIKKKGWTPYRLEFKIKGNGFSGIIDAIFKDPLGRLHLVDWKFKRRITKASTSECLSVSRFQILKYMDLYQQQYLETISKIYICIISPTGFTFHHYDFFKLRFKPVK